MKTIGERVGFYPGWSAAQGYPVSELARRGAAQRLTMICYAFGKVAPQDETKPPDPKTNPVVASVDDAWVDYGRPTTLDANAHPDLKDMAGRLQGNFLDLMALKAQFPHLKILISLGGWLGCKWFSDGALTASAREQLVRSALDVFLRGHLPEMHQVGGPGALSGVFDGIDVDWEYPACAGAKGNIYRPEDTENFHRLLEEFRRQLTDLTRETGRSYLLTTDLPASDTQVQHVDIAQVVRHVDWINVMAYDFQESGPTAFHSNLFSSDKSPLSVDEIIGRYCSRGASGDQLVLGVPFYGRGWEGVTEGITHGLYQPADRPSAEGSNAWNAVSRQGYPAYRDAKTGGFWYFDDKGRRFVALDDPTVLYAKMVYVRSRHLAGAMIWSMDSDDEDGTLMRVVDNGLALNPIDQGL